MPVINDTVIGKLNPITKIAACCLGSLSLLAWPDFTLGLILVVLLLVVSFLAHIQRDFAKIMFDVQHPRHCDAHVHPRAVPFADLVPHYTLASCNWGSEGVLYAAKVVVSLLVFLGASTS